MRNARQQQADFIKESALKKDTSFSEVYQHTQFQIQVLRNLYTRSEANRSRVQNEITLVE